MPEVYGSVSNYYGYRNVTSEITQGQDAAKTAASTAINAVDGVLNNLQGDGALALKNALSAITALGEFRAGNIAFSYQIPAYQTTAFQLPGPISLGTDLSAPTAPSTGAFSGNFAALTPGAISTAAPTAPALQQFAAPSLASVGGEPVAPPAANIAVPNAPDAVFPETPTLSEPSAPTLVALQEPSMELPELPDYTAPVLPPPPDLPQLSFASSGLTVSGMKYEPKRQFKASAELPNWTVLIEALPAYFDARLRQREAFSAGTTWASRGHVLDGATQQAQITYRHDMSLLSGAGEARRGLIDEHDTHRILLFNEAEQVVKQWRQQFELDELGLQKIEFDNALLYVNAYFDLFKSLTSLYNARVTSFGIEVAQYRNSVESALAGVERWKAEVDAEISKTKLNEQLAQTYASTVQARTVKASLYEANVQALFSKVEAYRSRMEAFATQAEVARVQLAVFKGKVDAYVASLASYKAQFEAFEARARSAAAENQVEEAKTKVSMADMQAAGASGSAKEIGMQIDAERLKLQARQEAASFENQKLKNTIEAVKAQIEGDIGRQKAIEWGANAQIKNVENDAIGAEAQAAARYYNSASDSAYRASEQAFRAVLSSTQAANVAQEAASRSAASVAQGAYSAIHVNAGLQGSGRVTADENYDAKNNRSISDWLNYSESLQAVATVP